MLSMLTSSSLSSLERKMRQAESFAVWKQLALEHDLRSGREKWKSKEKSKSYDYSGIQLSILAVGPS